jgi:hypothetical protein
MNMKKVLLLFAAYALLFTQCSKDGDLKSLRGTTWEYRTEGSDFHGEVFFKFGETTVSLSSTYSELTDGTWETETTQLAGTYIYDPPVIMITVDGETESGTVSGREMTFVFDGETIVFTRQ